MSEAEKKHGDREETVQGSKKADKPSLSCCLILLSIENETKGNRIALTQLDIRQRLVMCAVHFYQREEENCNV